MNGDRCDICGCDHDDENPVVLDDDGRLKCLECIYDLEIGDE